MRVLFILDPFEVEPLGVAYLAASLKQAGIETDWLESDHPMLPGLVRAYAPDVLAYSVTTGKHHRFLALNREIKKHYDAISVFGGSHPTYFPEMIQEDGVDAIVRGEAEYSFIKWLANCKPGIVDFHPLEQHLDEIPFPDRAFLYKHSANRNNPIKNVITSRGCKFSCPYCFNSIYRNFYKGQRWVRYRSPENVVSECLELKRYPLKMIYFQDDELLTNPRVHDLLELYQREVRVPFHCQIRIEFLTEMAAAKLKEAGCSGVTFAVESGNDYVRREVLGRRMSRDAIMMGADILHRYGLKFRIENMVGIPGESVGQMLDTLSINAQCKPTYGWASIFQPYPGLPLAEYAAALKLWDGSTTEFSESFFEHTVLKIDHKREIKNTQELFGLMVKFPVLRKAAKWVIQLPNNTLFGKLCARFKRRGFRRLYAEAYR